MKRNQMIQNQAAQDRSMRERTTGSRIPHMEEINAHANLNFDGKIENHAILFHGLCPHCMTEA